MLSDVLYGMVVGGYLVLSDAGPVPFWFQHLLVFAKTSHPPFYVGHLRTEGHVNLRLLASQVLVCTLVDRRFYSSFAKRVHKSRWEGGFELTARGTFENGILESRVECLVMCSTGWWGGRLPCAV